MPLEIKIPRLGWSGEEAKFVGWLKKEGEVVNIGEPLYTLEDEKATQDVESTESGTLLISKEAAQPGGVFRVGHVIGYLLQEGETYPQSGTSKGEDENKRCASVVPEPDGNRVVSQAEGTSGVPSSPAEPKPRPAVSPRARRRAADLGVDVALLTGSGVTGRIIEADVLRSVQAGGGRVASQMRCAIAERTTASFSSIPHFYLGCEIDATELVRFREDLLAEVEATTGVRLTLSDLILRAQALALRAHAQANAIWEEGNILNLPGCDVGLVVGLPDGLLIPVLRAADTGDISALAKRRVSLVEDARAGRLSAETMKGGATSLSNLGTTRVDEFAAVIASPQSTMLAVGRAASRPFEFRGRLALRTTMKLRLSVDHRILDGGPAAEFLGTIVDLLENPTRLV
jgi:pyruvate dehydrogenase E2 component (dihydrolipoamide acetyltransferase)